MPARRVYPYTRTPADTKSEAVALIREQCKSDAVACRRVYGTAVVVKVGAHCWEVHPIKDPHGPTWARYTIHANS